MTVAERTREAVRTRPFLYTALRAGVVNYTAAARLLDVDEADEEAVAAALRRYAADLPAYTGLPDTTGANGSGGGHVRVNMHRGLGAVEDPRDALLTVGEASFAPDTGAMTAILAVGDVGAGGLQSVLGRLQVTDTSVRAAGAASGGVDDHAGHLVVVVGQRHGPDVLRVVEDVLEGD